MKRTIVVVVALCALLTPACAKAELDPGLEEEIIEQIGGLQLGDWEEYYSGLPEDVRALWGYDGLPDMLGAMVSGELSADYDNTLNAAGRVLVAAVRASAAPIGILLVIALISGFVGILLDDEKQDIKAVASFVCFGMYIAVVSYLITSLAGAAAQAIERLSGFCEGVTPVISTLLAAVGSVSAGGMVQPLTAFMGQTVTAVFKNVVLPLILGAAVIAVAGSLTGKAKLAHLYAAVKSAVKWIIGVVFTVFLGLMSVQGISAAGVDSISMRTLKYTLDKGIPVVGGAVSGTFDTARSCAVLVKNAAGVTGILLGLGCIALPLVQIAGTSIALKLSAAICAPIADERMSRMIADIADVCNYLAATIVAAGLMFVIMLGLFIATGRIAV